MLFLICFFRHFIIPISVDYQYVTNNQQDFKKKIMLMQTTGHIWTKEEISATTDLNREFNNYLDSFRSVVVYAAEIYGFYHEIDRMVNNLGSFTKQLKAHPDNAMAVALSARRNNIYRELIMQSVDVVNDIRLVCLSSNKMTEKERMESKRLGITVFQPRLKVCTFARTNYYEYGKQRQVQESP